MRSASIIRPYVFILIGLTAVCRVQAQSERTVLLRYQFNKDQVLRYQTETHDSSVSDIRGQSMTNQTTLWSVQSITVTDVPSEDRFNITVKTDTMWSDRDETSPQEGAPGGGRRRSFRGNMGPRESSYLIRSDGNAESTDKPVSPFLIPLPENPISVNETWNFEIEIEQRGRRQGTTSIKGQCLLYDIVDQNGSIIALIIVNTETRSEGRFQIQSPQGEVTGSYAGTDSGTNLVYFDVEKGAVIEVVSENVRESTNESSMFASSTSSKSNTTVKLLND